MLGVPSDRLFKAEMQGKMKAYLKSKLAGTSLLRTYYMLYPQKPLYRESLWACILLSRWVMWFRVYLGMAAHLAMGNLRSMPLAGHLEKVTAHNALANGGATFCRRRSEHLIYLLKSIPSLGWNRPVLSIGPRNEGEILLLKAHGFKNVKGIDLFTYSPLIRLMDMHDMDYPDNSFDVIVAGWVVAYSDNILQCAEELIRVARPGAIIALSYSDNPPGFVPSTGRGTQFYSNEHLLLQFKSYVDHIYWNLDGENDDESDVPYRTHSVVFRVKK